MEPMSVRCREFNHHQCQNEGKGMAMLHDAFGNSTGKATDCICSCHSNQK